MQILVVDDEASIRELLTFNLKKNGYEVTAAADGREALAKAVGMDPLAFRMQNIMPQGFEDGFSHNVNYYDSYRDCMKVGRAYIDYDRKVAEYAKLHYQIIGLRDVDTEQIRRELSATNEDGVAVIARHMNYGLYRVEGRSDCPRDALNICRMLSLKPEILKMVEEAY